MAQRDAAQLILEVDARIATAQRAINQLARSIQQDSNKIGDALNKVAQTTDRVGKAVNDNNGRMRAGFTQLSFQIGDVSQQMALGVAPMRIFAQQSGQVIQALQVMGGEGNKFLQFMGGPWGIAIATAAVVLGPLAAKLFETGDEVDGLVNKMREQAKQAALNRQADDAWKQTIEGLTEAIRKRREEQEKSLQTDIEAEQATLREAQREVENQRRNLARLREALVDATIARDRIPRNQGTNLEGASTAAIAKAEQRIAAIRKQIETVEADIRAAEASVRGAAVPIAERNVEARVDKVKAATDAYTRTLGELRKALQAGSISQAEFERRLEAARRKLDAVKESAKESSKETRKIAFGNPAPGATQTSGFGFRNDPFTGERKFHGGVDLAGGPGRINAPEAGIVIRTGRVGGFGNVVWIDHGNGIISELNHLATQTVKVGQAVEAGQQVGVMGSTGRSTGRHLDWRVRTGASPDGSGGKYVDPRGKFTIEPGSAVARAEQVAAKAAEEALNRKQAFEAELAKIEADILRAKGELLQGDEAQADFAIKMLQAEQLNYEATLARQVADGKLNAADSETLKAKHQQLTFERMRAVELGRRLKQLERESEAEQRQFEYRIDDLRHADEMARTQADHRRLQLDILDVVYQQKEAALRDLKARLVLADKLEDAAAVQAQLDRLPTDKAQDTTRTLRGTMNPLEAWADSIPQTAAEVIEAMQAIEARGLDSLADAITSVIMGTESLGEAFSNVAKSIIADIIQMTVRMLIFRAISGMLGGGSTTIQPVSNGTMMIENAKGNVFSGGNIIPFARGGIVSGPTLFPMGRGQTGLMGEAGKEAIMPLARDSMGRLGVRVAKSAANNNTPHEPQRVIVELRDSLLEARIASGANVQIARTYPALKADTIAGFRDLQRR